MVAAVNTTNRSRTLSIVGAGKPQDTADLFIAATEESLAAATQEAHLSTEAVVPAFSNPFQQRQVVAFQRTEKATKSLAKSPEAWMLCVEMLEELGKNRRFIQNAPEHAPVARRLGTLHYVNEGKPVDNKRSLNYRLSLIVAGIIRSGKPMPEILVLSWNCDRDDPFFESNKLEYQLLAKIDELYAKYSLDDAPDAHAILTNKARNDDGHAAQDDNQFAEREAELEHEAAMRTITHTAAD